MKRVLFSLLVIVLATLHYSANAQTFNIGTDCGGGVGYTYTNHLMTDRGAFWQKRILEDFSTSAGSRKWEFNADGYFNTWRAPSGTPINIAGHDQVVPPNSGTASAFFRASFGGGDGARLLATTNGSYYTFNISEPNPTAVDDYIDQHMAVLATTYNPQTISSVTSVWGNYGARIVTVTLAAAPASGENVFVRYTTDNYVTSSLVLCSFVGNVGTATIPVQAQNATVNFYAYSTNRSSAAIGADVTTYGQLSHDMSTLELGGSGSYTMPNSPVIVTSSAGSAAGVATGYATMQAAFTAINGAAVHLGTMTIALIGNTTETASAVLNQVAGVTAIGIQPAGGAARTISGAITGILIDLNGADNVTIDGLNTGGNSLTISNTATLASNTIRYIADATNNTIQNCNLFGSASTAANGVVFFSTGTTTGNDGNNINNCNISAAGANLPINAIYSAGTSAAIDNSGNTLNANNISDYFNAAAATVGINLSATGNSAWTLTNNKLFQTATRLYTTANTHSAILIGVGSGYSITGNTIGFANAAGTGTTNLVGNSVALTGTFPSAYTTTGTSNATRFIAINCAFTAGGAASSIQNNTVAGIALFTSSGATTSNGILCGINITSGNANVGTVTGNTIGATSGNSSLYAANTSGGGVVVGIYATSTNTVTIQNNTIGAIDAVGTTATFSGAFTGIDVAGAFGVFTISNNFIGNTTADNIRTGYTLSGANLSNVGTLASTTGATSPIVGIRNAATGTLAITGNTLRGWVNGTTTGGATTGIISTGAIATTINISSNLLGTAGLGWLRYAFANTNATGVTGISNTGGTAAAALTIGTNDFRGITYTVSGTGPHTYVINSAATLSQNISSNTFTNLNVNTTGSVTFINNNVALPTGGSVTANSNSIVTAFNKGGAGGTVTLYLTTITPSSVAGTTKSIQSNNFSNITLTGATTMAGWMDIEGATGGGSTKTISNNTFSNWNCGTGAVNVIQCQYAGGASTISTNTISSITTSANTIIAITTPSTNGGTSLTISGNTITGLSSTGTGGAVTAISNFSASTTNNINGNIINTLSSTSTTATVVGITTGASSNIFSNTINTLSCVGTTSGVSNGIMVTAGTAVNVYKNKIYDLSTTGAFTTAPGVNGIVLSGSASAATINVYNNLIGDLKAATSASTDAIRGIAVTANGTTSTYNVYYNTVYLNATSSGANFGTSSIFHAANATATTAALNLRNNLIVNNSTANGTGLVTCFRRSLAATLANYASTSNNNLFYSATGSVMHDGTTAFTMASFKTAVSTRDAASVTEVISNTAGTYFQSFTGSNAGFLHIVNALTTQAESGGASIATYTEDYDGDLRNATTPDIGADEFAGVPADLTGPSISFTALANSCSTGDATLSSVTITDASGVPTTGSLVPRIYYRKGAGSWFSQAGTLSSGSATNGLWSFTIVAADMGGLAAADVVSYYVIAQDVVGTPNITSNAAGATATNVNTVSAAPSTPATYTVLATLSGTYTVGAAGNFVTLTAAVAAFNSSCVIGAVVFNLIDNSYTTSETYPITINNNVASSSSNTLTIKPTLANTVITGSSASAIIVLNGADYVTIDGSISATANTVCPASAASRDLTITNTNAGTSSAVIWIQTAASGTNPAATNNTVRNCNLAGNGVAQTLFGAGSGSATIGTSSLGNGNNSNAFVNNNISGTQYGIYSQGASAAAKNTGTVINQNIISTSAGMKGGIWTGFENSITISGNTVSNISQASSPDVFGITCGFGTTMSATTSSGNEVTNATITNNTIGSVVNSGAFSAYGIGVSAATSGTNLIANNMIYGVTSNGTFGDIAAGIVLGGGTGSTTNIYYNTVSMQGTITGGTAASQTSACLAVTNSTQPVIDLRNNIFSNTQIGNPGATLRFAAIALGYAIPLTSLTSNNNDLYVAGAGPGSYTVGITGTVVGGTNSVTLANWQTNTSKDAASVSVLPNFISTTNLHLVTGTNSALNAAGTPVSVTTDFDCTTRHASTPDIGADEFVPATDDAGVVNIQMPPTFCAGSVDVKADIQNFGIVNLNTVTINWTVNGVAQTPLTPSLNGGLGLAPGNTEIVLLGNFNFVAGTVYTIVVTSSLPNGNTDSNTGNDSFTLANIQTGLAGTYTVGAGGNFTTLTAAVNAFNTRSLCGAVTFNLIDANYAGETYPITLNNNANSSATNTLTIKATQAATTFTGSSATALIVLNGADYITIDGSTSSTANTVCPASAASRNLTLTNTNVGTSSAVIWLQTAPSGTNPAATNNTVKNCNLTGSGVTQTLLGAGSGSSTISLTSLGTGNNSNSFVNNNISGTQYGIYSQGASAAAKNSGTTINQNVINTSASMKGGILTGFENSITISGNTVGNISTTADNCGISVGFGTAYTVTTTVGNEVTNATVTNNTIASVQCTGTNSAIGIGISGSTIGTNLVANNMVYGVASNGTVSDFAAGIAIGGGNGSINNVYYNTVSMQGTMPGATSGSVTSTCLAITGTTPQTINVRNNIFTNTQIGNSGATTRFVAIAVLQTTFAGFTCNNNVLYSAGAGPGTYNIGLTGGVGTTGTARTTLANWQSATGTDAASVSMLPAFVSSTNLRVDGSNFVNGPIDNIGAVVSTTTDLDCATRSATTPDPGVNEFAIPVCFGTPTAGTASAAPAGPFCGSANTTLSIAGATGAVGITYQWQSSVTGLAGSFANVTGATSSTLVLTGLSTTNYYQCVVTCSYSALSATTNALGVIVNPNPTVTVTPSAPVLCGPGATALTASGADTYSWSPATGLSATTGASVTATLTSTTTYTVTGTTTATGCQGSTNVTVTVAPAATPVTVVATPDPVCQGGVVNLSATVPSGTLTVLSENFNGGTNNWTTTNTSTGGTPALAAWTLRPNGYVYSTYGTWNSNDNSQFYLSNSDAQGSGSTTATILQSPAFSTVGLTSCNLSFYHYYLYNGTESANVEVSTNGTTWSNLATYTSTQGAVNGFTQVTLSLNAYVGNPTVFVRFKYDATWDYFWGIDNVIVTAPVTYTYAWSSDVGGFTSTAAAPTHSPNVNTNYTVTVTNNFGCTGTDNEPVAVIPAPAVFAGPDQNTCGTGAYAITGATAQNTTSVNWTTTGSGTFTGTGTLTPSYSPTGAEIGTSITFYLNGVGNAPCLAASDSLVLTVAPLNTYYLDNDGDGFGNPFLSATGCTAPVGYVTDNTDCNDSNASLNPYTNWYGDFDGDGYGSFIFLTSCTNPGLAGVVQQGGDCDDNNPAVFPGSPEICQNFIDDDCDGQVDENCSGLVNDNRVNAIAVIGSLTSFPTCASISGSCLNAAISPEGSSAYVAAGGGRDVWYKFVAPSPGVHIKLTPNGFNGLIELQTAAGVYVDHENANTTASGLDILNRAGLTTGATYFVAVRNYDNSAGGTFTLCISPLMDSNCDNGSGTYPMCSNLKADYTGANNYTFNFDPTGATTGSNTSGTAVGQIYLTPSAPLSLQYGGTYNVTIDANYTGLVNGLGSADPIVIPGTEICSITLTAQPNVQTKATQLCSAPATLLKGSVLQGKPFVCSAINFTLEFTQLTACAAGTSIGMPFYGTTTGASASINLSTVAGVTGGGKWYQVRWRPNFSSGPGAYGTPSVIYVGGAVMGTDDGNVSMTNSEKTVAGIEAAIYPNPNNGEMLNLNLTNVDAKEVYVRITDGMGKLIYTHQYIVEGSLNTQVTFEQPISAGLYLVEFISNGEVTTQKMIVER